MKKLFAIAASIALCFSAFAQEATKDYGYKQTGFMSTPKVGAYIIGSYKYSDREGANGGPGFGLRLIRAYVDGSIFGEFNYRVQFQAGGGTPHVKDYFIEWARFKEFSVKMGQFKRAFTFENPMNPWDVGVGDFSLLVQKFAGMGDRLGEANMGGRDQGIQIQGDLLPIGKDQHRLVHYQLGLYNGQGINAVDANKTKDLIGTIQFQPIKGLYVGAFGWKGTWTNGSATAIAGEKAESGASDALYVTAGIPVADWLKIYVKWDEFRVDGTSAKSHDMYSAAANFRLHKNLNFQLEYRHHNDRVLSSPNYNEIWLQTYIRW